MSNMKTKIFLFIAGAFLITNINAQDSKDNDNFESWDANNDGKIDKEEYSLNSETFNKWDDNNDNRISGSEFQESYFGLFDADSDGKLQSDELSNLYFLLPSESKKVSDKDKKGDDEKGEVRYGAGTSLLGEWDSDKDGTVNEDEFGNNVKDVFDSWDANNDNYVNKVEFYNNSFNWWDIDRNGNIEKSEFEEMKSTIKDKSFWEKIF